MSKMPDPQPTQTITSAAGEQKKAKQGIWQQGQLILKEYRIEKTLGQGGVSKVYLAQHIHSQKYFAVKVPLFKEDIRYQRLLFRELRTWIDLPEHPHLTACRFFRKQEGRTVIFAEYVDGGSLKDWIDQKKLLKLENILDVAIQFAYGIYVAHSNRVVHQDIKPANVLLTRDGVAKITDFGLSRAHELTQADKRSTPSKVKDPSVSTGVMTPAYCSPEQRQRKKLDFKTDIWSYGLSILTLFTGSPYWITGVKAEEFLRSYLAKGAIEPYPAMPDSLADILYRCFQRDPAKRWDSMAQVYEVLKEVYRNLTGSEYQREIPEVIVTPTGSYQIHDRTGLHDTTWKDPVDWLERAFIAADRDTNEMIELIPEREGSRKAQILVDLEVFENAEAIYFELAKAGNTDVLEDLASLYFNKASVFISLDDLTSALRMYDKVINIYDKLVFNENRTELASDLVNAYLDKGHTLQEKGDFQFALAVYDQTIKLLKWSNEREYSAENANGIAKAYMNKGVANFLLQNQQEAISFIDQAIEIWVRLVDQEGFLQAEQLLGLAYLSKVNSLKALGENALANETIDKALIIYETQVHQKDNKNMRHRLSMVYETKAAILGDIGEHQEAVLYYDKAIRIEENLFHQEGRSEFANELAVTYLNKANSLVILGEYESALSHYNKSMTTWERLIYQEGRSELEINVAFVYTLITRVHHEMGDYDSAIAYHDKAIEIGERLVNQQKKTEFRPFLAGAYQNKTLTLIQLKLHTDAISLLDKAIKIREQLVNDEGKAEFLGDLAVIKKKKADVLLSIGEVNQAKSVLEAVIPILESEIKRTDRGNLKNCLATAMEALNRIRDTQ